MIAVVDYGAGNLRSVRRAFERCGAEVVVSGDPSVLAAASRLVFPGQGAFPECMEELRRTGIDAVVRDHVARGRPYLGICLGLQVLFDESEEQGGAAGLGLFRGRVVRFPHGATGPDGRPLKVPHMGWTPVERTETGRAHAVLSRLPDAAHFYFVHSYYVCPEQSDIVALRAEHGLPFCAGIASGAVVAVQFHPEKSQEAGEALLRAWLAHGTEGAPG
ncbi:MAG: imidazole glycerol phosphate synthase subunit HisH [Deltaproteobacteria bacterium]|nr:MAG: imidazole glycerol phosphate synthase subunit HisH [Deltaproteobacteria bacterium]